MDETLENKRQAVKPYEPAGVVSVAFLHRTSWTGIFSVVREHQMGRNASGIFVCGCTDPGHIASAEAGTGFYIQRRIAYKYSF